MKKSEKIKELGDCLNKMQDLLLASEAERMSLKEKLDFVREILNEGLVEKGLVGLSNEDSRKMLMEAFKLNEPISFYGNNLHIMEFEVESLPHGRVHKFILSNGSKIVIQPKH
jgi:hypothetical protein